MVFLHPDKADTRPPDDICVHKAVSFIPDEIQNSTYLVGVFARSILLDGHG